MPALFIFLLKVNIALLVFCGGYYLVLRRLTFYTLNRIYLILSILLSTLYPFADFSAFWQRHRQMAAPVRAMALNFRTADLLTGVAQPAYWRWIEILFWAGVIVLALRLLVQFISLFKIYSKSSPCKLSGHRVRIIKGDAAPFSFGNHIYINPDNHSAADLKSILLHEQVHVSQWHTFDILLVELSVVFYWFNPGVWLMKKAVRENIEFITDRKILQKGVDPKTYQYSLVNVSFAAAPQGIVNHFNISTIKKRIIMMNAKKSSGMNITRYALLLPAVGALLLVFTVSKAAFVKKNHIHKSPEPVSAIKKADAVNQKPAAPALKKSRAIAFDTVLRQVHVYTTVNDTPKIKSKNSDTIKDVVLKLTLRDSVRLRDDRKDIIDVSGRKDSDKYVTTRDRVYRVKIVGSKANIYKIGPVIKLDTAKSVDGKKIVDIVYLKKPAPQYAVTVKGNAGDDKVYTIRPFQGKKMALASVSEDREFSLDHLSDKLIVIDGKIASRSKLKHLPAFDIDRMTYKDDEGTKQLYGDKAQNGVIFIITKKGGK